MIAGATEKDIYNALNMDLIPPEMRENQGEIELAQKHNLPKLVELSDTKGDLHYHSNWDGGADSIEEMVQVAQGLGYEYIGVSDHTKFLRIEHGLDEKKIIKRNKEIDKLNTKLKAKNIKFRILKGVEANILSDGSIDIKDEVLEQLDFVIAGIHSAFKMEKAKMTQRMIKAMQNPNVDIISHPTGRILKKRDEYQIDFEKVLCVTKETKTILEINSYPGRLDLNDVNIRRAKELGIKMVINTDAHAKDQLQFMEFGVSQARRGWAEKKDIINAWPLDKLLRFLK
jgi:DNA polymerase (family 10)